MENEQQPVTESEHKIIFPAQCSCGHLFLENYTLNDTQPGDPVAFCWCGFCSTRLNIFADNTFLYVQKKPERVSEKALMVMVEDYPADTIVHIVARELLALRAEHQSNKDHMELYRAWYKQETGNDFVNTDADEDDIVSIAIAANEARWQHRLNFIHAEYGVDGSGCDSGDPLDLTYGEARGLATLLENARYDLASAEALIGETLSGADQVNAELAEGRAAIAELAAMTVRAEHAEQSGKATADMNAALIDERDVLRKEVQAMREQYNNQLSVTQEWIDEYKIGLCGAGHGEGAKMSLHICCFDSEVSGHGIRKGSPEEILAKIRMDGGMTIFWATETQKRATTLGRMERQGAVTCTGGEFPHMTFQIEEK
jgi:hypothetical protein